MLRKTLHTIVFAVVFIVCAVVSPQMIAAAVPAQATTKAATSSAVSPSPEASIPPAVAPLNLTLSPVTLNVEAQPGESATVPLKVRNNGTETEYLELSFETFSADETGAKPLLMEANPNDEFMKWISVDEPKVAIAPGEWKTLRFTFSPPPEAALTYYYAILFNRASSLSQPGQTNIQGVPAMLVLTNVVSPNAKKELQLDNFRVQSPILEFLPVQFSFAVRNIGNVHAAPSGTLFIDGQGKKDIAVLPINPGNSMVLPNSTRSFTLKWEDGFPHRDEQGKLVWDLSSLSQIRFGKYTAHLIMVYDNGDRDVPIESFVTFWVIPWRVIALLLAIPLTPAIVVFLLMKMRYRK